MSELRIDRIRNQNSTGGLEIVGNTTISDGGNDVTISAGVVTAKTINAQETVESSGQVISGVSTVDVITGVTSIGVGSVYASTLYGDASNVTGLDLSKSLTIGVRSGSAVTFAIVGSSFDVVGRSGNISIDV